MANTTIPVELSSTPGIVDNSNATAITIDSSENVGIGNTSPVAYGTGITTLSFKGKDASLPNRSGAIVFDSQSGSGGGAWILEDAGVLSFATGSGAGLAATERLRIDSSGRVTMPYQPAFSVQPTSTQSNIAEGSFVTVILGTETFDVGANFASNTFTAPVTGKYQLNLSLRLESVDTAANYYQIRCNTSNRPYYFTFHVPFAADATYWSPAFSVLADMDANDTVYMEIAQAGGTVQTDIHSETYFTGYLVA